MGKLNYINRKTSGSKLGATVQKDVIKHSQMAAKARSAKDPHLDVILQGKALGDDGLQIACEGFLQALSSGFLNLGELDLSSNELTVAGLKYLGPVIRAAAKDIKDLDLRGNELMVSTDAEETIWEQFLESFRDVCCLRRIDFSDNPIGDRGFEILWRVYSRESPIRLPAVLKTANAESSDDDYSIDEMNDDSDIEGIYEQASKLRISDTEEPPSPPPSLQTTPTKQANPPGPHSSPPTTPPGVELHGLRSVPFMVFCRSQITDCSALFLSYIIPIHPLPERLMPYIPTPKVGYQADLLEAYKTTGCSGIIYKPSDTLSTTSTRLLECAEYFRNHRIPSSMDFQTNPRHRRLTESSTNGRPKKDSISTNHGAELDHGRAKIQGNVIREYGADHVQLWGCALRMLVLCRTLFFGSEESPWNADGSKTRGKIPSIFTENSNDINRFTDMDTYSPPPSPTNRINPGYSYRRDISKKEQSIFTEIKPEIARHTPVIIPLDLPSPGLPLDLREVNRRALPGNLSEDVWISIIKKTADSNQLLSSDQCLRIVVWAKSRETLEKERELAGKLPSVQIWKVLDGMGCLSYDVDRMM
ncbi:hypothetical protein EDC01DRAFT_732399 [Geopyxis carbonaria]|nr:hypothetical protein EDC01DRAFT_732399 [Geopyxis carbonaria]